MKYVDRIYGAHDITQDVIIDIIHTSAFERLVGIEQAGYFDVYFPGTKHSRFEHSIGCYLLLKKFGASLEEQIAGLIHDMSHTAFSHTADYVFAQGRGADHNYQDDIFVDFMQKTDVPQILEQYGYDVNRILNESNFPLQETQLPELCADRIDYSLRGATIYGVANKDIVTNILGHLHIVDQKWVFDNYDSARQYAEIFKKLNDIYYSCVEAGATFLRTSRWIKYALKNNYIIHNDLFTTDDAVITQINAHIGKDDELQKLWDEMNNAEIVLGTKDTRGEKVVVKSRIIDPLFMTDSGMQKLSQKSQQWNDFVRSDSLPKTYYIV